MDLTGGWIVQANDRLPGCCFAATRLPHQSQALTAEYIQIYTVQRPDIGHLALKNTAENRIIFFEFFDF